MTVFARIVLVGGIVPILYFKAWYEQHLCSTVFADVDMMMWSYSIEFSLLSKSEQESAYEAAHNTMQGFQFVSTVQLESLLTDTKRVFGGTLC